MNPQMFTAFFAFFFLSSVAFAEEPKTQAKVREGEKFIEYALEDQHGVPHRLSKDTRFVLIASEMELSKDIHQWLSQKDTDFLDKKKTEYVSDITPMPDIITYLFAGPKMRKYPFRILLADDEAFGETYPKEEGKIAAFELDDDGTVAKIEFYENMDEIDKEFLKEKPSIRLVNYAEVLQNLSKPNNKE